MPVPVPAVLEGEALEGEVFEGEALEAIAATLKAGQNLDLRIR